MACKWLSPLWDLKQKPLRSCISKLIVWVAVDQARGHVGRAPSFAPQEEYSYLEG